ncbi:uncharacterized protein LOC131317326 [Rhododendron vialii]|uniref:uncharacterized protein LOC131317326 n=1 Tax=Rhododendron vialii TaxID=182163 RepID=UPI00265D7444|nr:uncharacterized protein LOC131317326 [Rhododendron vialii]
MARGNEDMVVGGGKGTEAAGQEIGVGATVVAAEGEGGGPGAEPSGGDATVGAPVVAAAGDQGAAAIVGGGAEVAVAGGSGSGDGGSDRPLTPTVEELLVASERASDGGPADLGGEEGVEPRGVLDVLGLDSAVAAVLRDASTPEDRASASLLGALLSGAGSDAQEVVVPEAKELGGDRVDAEAAAEVRVTAVDEAKAYLEERRTYLAREQPEFTPATYAP